MRKNLDYGLLHAMTAFVRVVDAGTFTSAAEQMDLTTALLSFMTMGLKPDANSIVYFIGIDGARFKRPVEPGDQLRMDIEILRHARGIWKYKATASVDGQIAVEAELMCTMRNASDPTKSAE